LLPTLKEMFENMIIWFQDNRENFADFAKIVLEQIRKLVTFVSDFKEVLLGAGSAILGLMVLSKVIPLMKLLGVTTSVSMGPIGLAVVAVGLLVGAFFKLRREMRELKDQEKLLDDAMAGDLKSTEDYNDAISLQQGKIKGLISTYMKQQEVIESRGEVRGRESDLAYKAHLERLKEARAELGIIRENSEEFKKIEEEKLKVEAENAQKELQLIYDKALETSNAEQEKRDEIAATADAVEEAISRTKGAMEGPLNNPFLETFDGAGFVAELYKVKEGVKTVEEVMDAFWEHEKNEAIDFDYVAKTSVEKFVDGWIETVEAVQEVFTLMYSALTGVTDQFFANKFAALEQDKATSDEFHNAEKEASDKIFKAKMKALDKLEDAGEDVSERRKDLMDEEEIANQALADAKLVSDKKLAKDKYDLELKQFKISKAMNIAQALMNTAEAVSKALTLGPILGLVMAGIVGALGAVQVGMIAGQAPPPAPFIRGGLTDKMIAGGAVRGNPGIDTNNVALTNREYVMPPQQSMDNFDELEDMRAGGTGGKNITIMPAQVDLIMNDRTVGTAVIEFMTAESDRGGFRINPKVLGALT